MISKEDIAALAELARLKLKPGEDESLRTDVSNILGYVGQVSEFSSDADRTNAPLQRNVMREDVPRDPTDPVAGKEEVVRSQFPKRDSDYNVVRKIIQKDE